MIAEERAKETVLIAEQEEKAKRIAAEEAIQKLLLAKEEAKVKRITAEEAEDKRIEDTGEIILVAK